MYAGAEAAYPLRPQPRLDRGRARRVDPASDRLCRGAPGARGVDHRQGRVRGDARGTRLNLFGIPARRANQDSTTISAVGSAFVVESSTRSILRCCGSAIRVQTMTGASDGMARNSSINSSTVMGAAFS